MMAGLEQRSRIAHWAPTAQTVDQGLWAASTMLSPAFHRAESHCCAQISAQATATHSRAQPRGAQSLAVPVPRHHRLCHPFPQRRHLRHLHRHPHHHPLLLHPHRRARHRPFLRPHAHLLLHRRRHHRHRHPPPLNHLPRPPSMSHQQRSSEPTLPQRSWAVRLLCTSKQATAMRSAALNSRCKLARASPS